MNNKKMLIMGDLLLDQNILVQSKNIKSDSDELYIIKEFKSNFGGVGRIVDLLLFEFKYSKFDFLTIIDDSRYINEMVDNIYGEMIDTKYIYKSEKWCTPRKNRFYVLNNCDKNCNEDNFEHITNLSKTIGCDLTFRIAENANYYHNDSMDFALTDNQMNLVRSLFGKYKNEDKFMNEALKFYNTGISEIMYDYDKNMPICGAGKDFAFIQSNGDIFPCIYSSIKIGDLNGFNDNYLFDYHVTPKCPCMTECAVWPTIIRNERNGKQSIK